MKLFNKYPKEYEATTTPKTDDEAKYFTYRQLSALGSSGIRK